MLLVLLALVSMVSSQTYPYCTSAEVESLDFCGTYPSMENCCAALATVATKAEMCRQCCDYDPNSCQSTNNNPNVCQNSGNHLFKIKYRGNSGQFELRSACGGKNEKFSVKMTGITEIECVSGTKTTNKITSFTSPTWNTIRGQYQGNDATRIEYTNQFNVRGNNVGFRFETVFFDNSTANLTYGNDTVEVPLYGIKFSFEITNWQFTASNGMCLDVGVMISSNGASTEYQSNEGNSVNVRFSDTLNVKNPKTFLIDGNTAQKGVTVTSGTKKINYLLDLGTERGNVITYDPVFTANFITSDAFKQQFFIMHIFTFVTAFFIMF